MEFLQIRRNCLIETNAMRDVKDIRLESGHIDNYIVIDVPENGFVKVAFSHAEYDRTVRLYNELLRNILGGHTVSLIIECDKDNHVHQWWWHDDFEELLLEIPDRKYKVGIEYAFHVDVAVDAKDEAEAERKAQKMVNCGQFADEVNEAVGGANVIECHAEEIK